MPKITLDVSDELARQIAAAGERLPELLSLGLQQSPVPTQIYRYILDFLTSNPTPEQIAAFRPTPEMVERLQNLLSKHKSGDLTHSERSELLRTR